MLFHGPSKISLDVPESIDACVIFTLNSGLMKFGRNIQNTLAHKIDLYNFELYRFKVGAFLRHSVYRYTPVATALDRIKVTMTD